MRDLSATLLAAINSNTESFRMCQRAEVYPSRIFFSGITSDYAVSGADAVGVNDDPMPQDIGWCSNADKLATFWCDGNLKYALEGSASIISTSYTSTAKPGIFGSKLYLGSGGSVYRYSIDWAAVAAGSSNPLSSDTSAAFTETVLAVHGVSATECVVLTDGDGGIRPVVMDGSTLHESVQRFMFPFFVDNGSQRTLASLAVFSGALKLGNKIFVYASNHQKGCVEAIAYDTTNGTWSDIFIALATDILVSQCEFRVANAYTHNGTAYLCGQLTRTDAVNPVYRSLLLSSDNGKTFSLDSFTLVANIGYRFLGHVANDKLYLGNCNRVCKDDVTWLFDGVNGTGVKIDIPWSDIHNFNATDCESASMTLVAGERYYVDTEPLLEGSRIKVFIGYDTTIGYEYILYGTYIIADITPSYKLGGRTFSLNLTAEAVWRLNSYSMPYYFEISGKSCAYDAMKEVTGQFYPSDKAGINRTSFFVDFWNAEAYSNTTEGITGTNVLSNGGVGYVLTSAAHKLGFRTPELKTELYTYDNPEITDTSVVFHIYGWSHALTGSTNDIVELILITEDEDGVETVTVSNEDKHWPNTYPSAAGGDMPIVITMSGLTVGDKIKYIGISFEEAAGTRFNIARVEVTGNMRASEIAADSNESWELTPEEDFRVPATGRPYIMFSQSPYNARNFCLEATFTNTVSGTVAGYAAACGLVGLAEDGMNYILGRWNMTTGDAEIVCVRMGVETILANASYTPGDTIRIQFSHKEGHFEVLLWNDTNSEFDLAVSYDWTEADGFMYTDEQMPMKCGLYGVIGGPWFRIAGYDVGFTDNSKNADGVAMLPLESIADFPSSGTIQIGENEYSYTGKSSTPSPIHGPYQLRQYNYYASPFGINKYGLEFYDFDWNAVTTLLNNCLLAVDSGATFVISAMLWRVWITTHGEVVWLYGRARAYSENTQIGKIVHTCANKVWASAGLLDLVRLSGDDFKHYEGDICKLKLSGEIRCTRYSGSSGESTITVADIANVFTRLAGFAPNFPGDIISSSQVISGETTIDTLDYVDGIDLQYEAATQSSIDHIFNVIVSEDMTGQTDDTGLTINITHEGSGSFTVAVSSEPSGTLLTKVPFTAGTANHLYRILLHSDYISIFIDDNWVTTFCTAGLDYGDSVTVKMDGSFIASNLKLVEFSDWREAVYIDQETQGGSALSGLFQQRPVEMVVRSTGMIDFFYDRIREEITSNLEPVELSTKQQIPDCASDIIIYGSEDVVVYQDEAAAAQRGFTTKIYKMSDLNVGAFKAAMILQKRGLEGRKMYDLTFSRPDIRIEPGDVYSIDYIQAGTGAHVQESFIVESAYLRIGRQDNNMRASGREYIP
jgi:hypothetical protein